MTDLKIPAEDAQLLRAMVRRLIAASTVHPGQCTSSGVNTTGRTLLMPGTNEAGRSTYPAFWIRDPAWIAETGLIPAQEVWGWLELMTSTMQGHESRYLSSGAIIPPYSIADHINVDGSPVFYPGTYCSDGNQGPPYGVFPPHDNQYCVTLTAYAYAKLSDTPPMNVAVPTPMGDLPLSRVCELTHNAFPVDGSTQLCVAPINVDQHIVDWGYNDTITKTGKLLFPSLLRYESALKLAHLFEAAELHDGAATYQQQATRLQRSIIETFYQEDDSHAGMLMSATGIGYKPDVWGSAYAVYLNLLPDDLEQATARWLLRAYQRGDTTLLGQIRHLSISDGTWPLAKCAPGMYQNGGYWGYATGWYVYALSRVDTFAAAQLFSEYLSYQRSIWDDSLRACSWECINPAINHYQNPGYLATIALPYVALQHKKLID